MVLLNTGSPDPDHPNEDLRVSNEDVLVITDDDSDQELDTENLDPSMLQYGHYQLLPTFPQPLPTFANEALDIDYSDEDADNGDETHNEVSNAPNNLPEIPVPPVTTIETTLLKEVWSASSSRSCDIEMDSKKVDEVKQAMSNIVLPPSAIPDWAADIPEEEWKQQLIKRLENIG
ncbi:uncharacterized protein LOC126881233 [Diabrotica virgifera virgifera]|uniref:Male-enhanced antigen 1 n=1 Tax=Diabrotica virgifera virgifera TaxID=50390 RepID=A0A6P7GDK7_DIAVI|nr:uncharacterized protein LOC126881233 [Diabrotica virgifera virgifera]